VYYIKVISATEGNPVQSETLLDERKVQWLYFLIIVVLFLDFKVPSLVAEVNLTESYAAASKTKVIKFS
jgi:hypothetical protein